MVGKDLLFTKLTTKIRLIKRRKVFGIGLPKTGTKTLRYCFQTLGYKHHTFDMALAAQVKKKEISEALDVAERFETFEDWPWFLIYRELDRRFPGSKFVLTLRKDEKTYIRSLKKHHQRQGIKKPDFNKPPWWDDVFGFAPDRWDYQKSANAYAIHTQEVLDYFKFRPEDLLVVCWEKGDGWRELCHFIDRPCPCRPFPKKNASPV